MSSLPGSVEHPLLPCVQGLIWVNSGGRGQRDLSSGLPPTADVAAVNGHFGSGPTTEVGSKNTKGGGWPL